jgi:hypothetical protein
MVVRAAIPNASSATAEVTPQGTLYSFYLPSGKGATLVFKNSAAKSCLLVVGAEPAPPLARILGGLIK